MRSLTMARMTAARPGPHPRIELIGLPRLIDARGEPVALERKAAALLAVLALDGMRSRASLVALLWPEASLALGRNSLRQRLFRRPARGRLRAGRRPRGAAPRRRRRARRRRCRVGLRPIAQRLRRRAARGLDFGDTPELAEWVERRASAGAAERRPARRARRGSEARQQIVKRAPVRERLVADEPLLEHAHRRVMRLHYLHGDRAAALAAYERCEALKATSSAPPRIARRAR